MLIGAFGADPCCHCRDLRFVVGARPEARPARHHRQGRNDDPIAVASAREGGCGSWNRANILHHGSLVWLERSDPGGRVRNPQWNGRCSGPRSHAARQAAASADHRHGGHAVSHRRRTSSRPARISPGPRRRSLRDRYFPTATASSAGDTRAALVKEMQSAMTKAARPALDQAQL